MRKRPVHQAEFQRNYEALEKDLMALDTEIESLVASKLTQLLVASHPVYHSTWQDVMA